MLSVRVGHQDREDRPRRRRPGPRGRGSRPRRARSACSTDDQVLELARLAMAVEEHYGTPQDIEWAMADGKTWLVQSRPITTLHAAPSRRATPTAAEHKVLRPWPGGVDRPRQRCRAGPDGPLPARPAAAGRGAGRADDQSRLDVRHPAGRCAGDRRRRDDLPRGDRVPRAGRALRRGHPERHHHPARRRAGHRRRRPSGRSSRARSPTQDVRPGGRPPAVAGGAVPRRRHRHPALRQPGLRRARGGGGGDARRRRRPARGPSSWSPTR